MKNITYQQIIERYYYKDGDLYHNENTSSRARKDARVSGVTSNRYKQLKYNGMLFQYHRVIYCYFNECDYLDIDGWDVDHLDNDTHNNRIENLILCEHWENQLNRVDTKRNGGVTLRRDKNGKRVWTSYGLQLARERRNAKTLHIAKRRKDMNDDEGGQSNAT